MDTPSLYVGLWAIVMSTTIGVQSIVLHTDSPAEKVYPSQPKAAAVLVNSDVTFYCSLPQDDVSNDVISDVTEMPTVTAPYMPDVTFNINGADVISGDITYVNESTASTTIHNVQLDLNSTAISCSTKDGEEDRMLLLVGVPPNKELTYQCQAFNWKRMTCTWSERNTKLFTNYIIEYCTPSRPYCQEKYMFPGSRYIELTRFTICKNQTSNSCFWEGILSHMYAIRLCEHTALNRTCTIPNFYSTIDLMKLPKVKNLEVTNVTARECQVAWDDMNDLTKYDELYEIFLSPRHINRSWTTFETKTELTNLLPNTEYTVNVRVIHTNEKRKIVGGFWSDNATKVFKTHVDVPDANPEIDPLGYTFERNRDKVTIETYWKEVPPFKRNGKLTYMVQLKAEVDGTFQLIHDEETEAPTITIPTNVTSSTYVIYIQAKTSKGVNVKLNASKIVINAQEAAPKVRFIAVKNETFTRLMWNDPSLAEDSVFTIFTCKGTMFKCKTGFNFIKVSNVTSYDIKNTESARYGLAISASTIHKERGKREVVKALGQETNLISGIQWTTCNPDMSKVQEPGPWNVSLAKSQTAESIALDWKAVPCYARTITFYLKSETNESTITVQAKDVPNSYYVIRGLVANELYEVYATWSWEYGPGPVRSEKIEYTVKRSGLTYTQYALMMTGIAIVVIFTPCAIFGMYRKFHKTVKEPVDIAVPARQQFERLTDMDEIDREDYSWLTGNTQEPTGPRQTMFETTETANRRITLDDPFTPEQRRQNVYHNGTPGIPAWRQRSQSLEARPKWQPPAHSRFRSNSVVETQQQMDAMHAAICRAPQRRGSMDSFTEEDGSIYFRMDSTSNTGSQGSLNSSSGPVMRPRALSVSSVGSAASSFLWMSNSNEDLTDLSPPDNCTYKLTPTGPQTSNDGYLKPRSSPVMHRRHQYKNFSVIREEDEENEYVPSSRDDNAPVDPLDAEVADVIYMAMSNATYDKSFSNGVSNLIYDYPKSYRSLTRGRLLSASSVGSGVLLEDDFEDENDLYRIASAPRGRQQRSMSFDVAASAAAFSRPRSSSVDVLDKTDFHPSLLRLITSGDNEYMNPDAENERNSERDYLNTKGDATPDEPHYKNMTSSGTSATTAEASNGHDQPTKETEDYYLAPIDHEKHLYSIVEDDTGLQMANGVPKKKTHLERQCPVVDDDGTYNSHM